MQLNDHIHLGISIGPPPENAPQYRWKITSRVVVPEVVMSLKKTIRGYVRNHVLQDTNGPIQYRNFSYTVLIRQSPGMTADDWMDILSAMNGRLVYLCDVYHPANGADHTPSVLPMIARIYPAQSQEPGLQFYKVEIDLADARRR